MGIFNLVSTVIDKIFPDKAEADKAKLALLELEQKGELAVLDALKSQDVGQAEINKVEAASTNWFVSGWRPGLGWITGFARWRRRMRSALCCFMRRATDD